MKGQWIIKEVYFEDGFPKIIRDLQLETPDVTPEVTPHVIDCPRCGHCCPQRQWVGLTMADMAELRRSGLHEISDKHFQAIEAKLREKSHE
jgi:hypothetical protein